MEQFFAERMFGIPWSVAVLVALAIAVAYVLIDTGSGASGWRFVLLRWFHPLCWVLLAMAALAKTRLTPLPVEWAAPIAAAGGLCYLAFIIAWVTRQRPAP